MSLWACELVRLWACEVVSLCHPKPNDIFGVLFHSILQVYVAFSKKYGHKCASISWLVVPEQTQAMYQDISTSHQDFKNIAHVGFFRHFVCVFVFVVVFVIVFVFVFVSSCDFWKAFIIIFKNMNGYMQLWSLRAVNRAFWKWWRTDTHSPIPLIDYRMGRVKITKKIIAVFALFIWSGLFGFVLDRNAIV